jgi:EAL domain-containing protein (putative c-di-GMP-specific phosphodiesterase class I)/GGDEF domain-containing protein
MDPVTGLPNRQEFLKHAAALRADATDFVMVTLADAKHFNEILRALGHDYSEEFVRAGVARIRWAIPPEVTLYHVSVLSIAFASNNQAEPWAEDLVRSFTVPLLCGGIPILTRIGVGLVACHTGESAALLRFALAAAQDSRRSSVGWSRYNRESDDAHRRSFTVLSDLSAALAAEDQLSLAYQPKIELKTGHCLGAEALLRWVHPTLGQVPPGEFIPLVEATAFIGPLTDWVIDQALRQSSRWRDEGLAVKIAINVSPQNLSHPGFTDRVITGLSRYQIDAADFELEFTEGSLASNDGAALSALRDLRDLGMNVALDDFGTGFCNLSYITSLPANILKIDQSFIRRMTTDNRTEMLVRGIIKLAHQLSYRVVAEGIETAEAYALLSAWGCDIGQGYFISRPMDTATFTEWLRKHGKAKPLAAAPA